MNDDETFEVIAPASTKGKDAAPKKQTKLDQLREKLEAEIRRDDVLIPIPERPNIMIRISPNIDQPTMRSWRKRAGEGTKNDFDTTKFSTIIVAFTCNGIFMDDEEIFNENGAPLTFASPEIMDFLGVTRPWPEGVRAMFGNDSHVEACALTILEAAGMGDSVEVVDPLKNS